MCGTLIDMQVTFDWTVLVSLQENHEMKINFYRKKIISYYSD